MAASPAAHAIGTETTFYWSANCQDCASTASVPSFGVTGTLTLLDYELGQEIGSDNFLSFSYSGSNLIRPFFVGGDVTDRGAGRFDLGTVYRVDGRVDAVPAANRFELQFDDGLFFQTQLDGSWSVCAPDAIHYYGGNSCGTFEPADFGNAAVFATTAPVPEPGVWAMLAAGLGVIGLLRRRSASASRAGGTTA